MSDWHRDMWHEYEEERRIAKYHRSVNRIFGLFMFIMLEIFAGSFRYDFNEFHLFDMFVFGIIIPSLSCIGWFITNEAAIPLCKFFVKWLKGYNV